MPVQFGVDEAKTLLAAGWRQGALFKSNWIISLPDEAKGCFWVILTQSCTVVSPRLSVDPLIEIAIARPLNKFNARAAEATGKNFRKLHVATLGADFEALEIDVNSRRFVAREVLLKFVPDGPVIDESETRKIGSWMGRYFSRVAVPNRLVEVLRPYFTGIGTILREQRNDSPLHESVPTVFIDWAPNDEAGPYRVTITVLAHGQDLTEHIDRRLIDAGISEVEIDNLKLVIEVRSSDATFLSEVDGKIRLSEWDYLTSLEAEI